jgi:hypothetical protein
MYVVMKFVFKKFIGTIDQVIALIKRRFGRQCKKVVRIQSSHVHLPVVKAARPVQRLRPRTTIGRAVAHAPKIGRSRPKIPLTQLDISADKIRISPVPTSFQVHAIDRAYIDKLVECLLN